MTYNVFGGTLNPTQSQSVHKILIFVLLQKAANTATTAADGVHQQSDISTSATRIATTAAELATTTELVRKVSSDQKPANSQKQAGLQASFFVLLINNIFN